MRDSLNRALSRVCAVGGTALVALALTGANLFAQQSPQSPHSEPTTVKLHIVTQGDVPVPLAEVTVAAGKLKVTGRTDSIGVFRVDRLTSGTWHASIRRIGYHEATVDFHIDDGENAFTVMLDESAATLEEVKIEAAHPYSARLAEFELRLLHKDANAVVTRADIEKRNPIRISQMLRGMAGLRIADSLGNTVAISTRGRKPSFREAIGSYCMLRLSIDGIMLPAGADIDNIVPVDVHGIEVFFGPSRVPPGMGGIRLDNWCGLIAVWTRDR